MNRTSFASGLMLSLSVVVALMPLSFTFSPEGIRLLIETPFRAFVWASQGMILLALLLTKSTPGKNKIIGLGTLYLLVPFVFTFDRGGIFFLILSRYPSSILSWAIAIVLFGRLLISADFKKKPTFEL